jgi:hypothetical protein
MTKSKKNKNKAKLNLTVRDEQRNKLEQMASLEKRSLSNLIEVMADERWKRLAEQQGVAYAKTVARIYGTRTPLPDGRDSRTYLAHLHELENEAKAAKRGAWGKVHR